MHAFVDWLQTPTLQVHIYPPYALKQENLRDSGFSKTSASSESVKIGLFETLEACSTENYSSQVWSEQTSKLTCIAKALIPIDIGPL